MNRPLNLRRGGAPMGARGFTLIEILVVMALIGIVIALVANRIAEGRTRGLVNATKIAVDNLNGKVETYSLDMGSLPGSLHDLVAKPGNAGNWNGPYAKEKELKDAWNHDFQYKAPGSHGNDFDVYSFGPDGKEGGEGLKGADIGNWQ